MSVGYIPVVKIILIRKTISLQFAAIYFIITVIVGTTRKELS